MLLTAAICITQAQGASKLPIVRIGMVRDGLSVRFPENVVLFQQEILDLTSGEFDVRFPPDKSVHGNWTVAGVKRAVDRLLADPKVDLIVVLGAIASNEVCRRRNLSKPVIAPFVIDAELQGLPLKDGSSGVKNLTYIDSFNSLKRDVKTFREIVSFDTLALLVDRLMLEAFPMAREYIRQLAKEYAMDIRIVAVDTSAEPALSVAPPETDAVLVASLVRLSPAEFQRLVSCLIKRRLPSFSFWGRDEVEDGLLASVAPKSDFRRLARRVALNVQRILLGEDAGTLKVAFTRGEQLTINMATARAIGTYPPWGVLTEADLLNEEIEDIDRRLSLDRAVREAMAANLDLAVADRNVAAGTHIIREARAGLLPQLDIGAQGVVIDEDRAEASFGTQAERTLSGSVTASQLLYSESTWSDFAVQRHLQVSREEERETLRLDIALDATIAYLNVLRAKTFKRIQKENLKLTRSNLEKARVRVSVGIASPAEVYRWESEIASSRQAVLAARAQRRQAETSLNRLLHRPLEEQFIAQEASLADPLLIVSDRRFFNYVDNPQTFRIFSDFSVEEGLAAAPESRRLDASIAAQNRTLVSARRAYWAPTLSLQGNVTETFDEGGAGADSSQVFLPISEANDTDWSVGIFATFPLFSGGAKPATLRRTQEELSRLRLKRQATVERIEERIRSALHQTSASYPSIQLSRDAAEAARKNLNLVANSYARGVISIIDLLDAQNAALVADQVAANAVYDFLVDLMRVQRAIGQFDFFLSVEEREGWFQRLEAYFTRVGACRRKP